MQKAVNILLDSFSEIEALKLDSIARHCMYILDCFFEVSVLNLDGIARIPHGICDIFISF